MDIRQLRYFIDIARTEHLTESAQNLFVTPSTLSHGLRQLEDELGVRLFDRLGRGLRLSHAGLAFRDYAVRSLQELEAGRMVLADMNSLKSGRLSIGAFPTFLNSVASTVAAFNRLHPGVVVEVRSLRATPIEQHLLSGDIDVGVGAYPAAHEDVDAEPLFDEQLVLVVGDGHALAGRRSVRMSALNGVALALLPRTFALRRQIDEAFLGLGIKPFLRVEIEPVESLIALCRHDGLASIVPQRAAIEARGTRVVLLTAPVMVRRAGILWRRGASRSSAALAFGALLQSAAAPGPQ